MTTEEIPADDPHIRPEAMSDGTVEALGLVSEALETVERARGALYEFHQLIGGADFKLDRAVALLEENGHREQADVIQKDLIGRNVIEGRWTFQIVEDFDDNYWSFFRHVEHNLRERVAGGRRHIFESELKEARRTRGHRHHESRP